MSQNIKSKRTNPLAQTFYVDNDFGVYITRIGVFFSSKSIDGDPITLELRPTEAGRPSSDFVMPGGTVTKRSSQVTTSTNATAETIFEFREPIFLNAKTWYAFCLKTNADAEEYKLWASRMGDFKLGTTTERITKQLEAGIFFKSSNSTVWTEDQELDVKFKLYRASFTPTDATVVFTDANPPRQALTLDPFYADSGSTTIRVNHKNHGFQVGDRVHFQGLTAATRYNGILGSSILGRNTVTAIDGNGYRFTADSASTSAGSFGGTSVQATQQFTFDLIQPSLEAQIHPNTYFSLTGDFKTSKSYASSTEVAYASNNGVLLQNKNEYAFDKPHVIMNDSNEALSIAGGESTKITVLMGRKRVANDYYAPTIDLQRAHMVAVANIIDRQDSAATVDFNVPLQFTAETHKSGGTSLSKHITKPVTLEEAAVGIKILMSVNRPEGSYIDVYYRIVEAGKDLDIRQQAWIEATIDAEMPTDNNRIRFREYRYTIGGEYLGTLAPFTKYQVKIVMSSVSSSIIPRIKDLRTIALGV